MPATAIADHQSLPRRMRSSACLCYRHREIDSAKNRRERGTIGESAPKQDALQMEQLTGRFTALLTIGNPFIAAVLQAVRLASDDAERHATTRQQDLPCVHHKRIEASILERANVPFVTDPQPENLRSAT